MKRLLFLLTLFVVLGMQAQQHVMTVDVSKPTARINPAMYGIFFEDINFGADGGLYAELVKNRSFEFPQPLVGCACCPSNISRFIPSLPGYVYAVKDNQVYVNLFLSNRAELKLNEKKVVLEQETGYPWNGDIRVKVAQGNLPFTMNIRIPGWVRGSVLPSDLYSYADDLKLGYRVLVNGEEVTGELRKGYLRIDRKWKKGDVVEVHFDMQPRVVKANEKVVADRGRVAVERGPIVYCAEWADNDFNIQNIILNRHPKFQVTEKPELLYGINEITTEVQALGFDAAGKLATRDVTLTLIPYYAWAHRGEGKMDVWLPVNRIDVE